MTKFRPCIDLHSGQVKQIVGGTLTTTSTDLKTNYVSKLPAGYFAELYKDNGLEGAHVIMLGPGNEEAAKEALAAWKGGLQVGGGINNENAKQWIDWGADKVIITSFLFPGGKFSQERLDSVLAGLGGDKEKLVIDLSCRPKGDTWFVAMDRWQTITDMEVNEASIKSLEEYCSEFLIHAADNEGLQKGVDEKLVEKLAEWCSIPVTYAGGGRSLGDLDHVKTLSGTRVDLTIGSALDIFGGSGVTFDEVRERDWRARLVKANPHQFKTQPNTIPEADSTSRYTGSRSDKQFGGWEVAWQLSMSESGRKVIAKELVRDPRSTGSSLEMELEKLLRQMMVLAQARTALTLCNWELKGNLERPALETNIIVQQILEEELKARLLRPGLEDNIIVQQIVQEHLATRERRNAPILAVGYSIRNRYLENSAFHSRNKATVLTGNEAAHDGDALADAILYHPLVPNYRKDTVKYTDIYGLDPHTVWCLQDCKPFLKMITWYDSVMRWNPYNFASTPFAKAWPADFFNAYAKAQLDVVRADFADGKKGNSYLRT
ncbi:related to 5` Pro-FAR isomerase [Rhynchosporium secalis]|uniref:1-(5-phosphoribosyl)-5-[(5-phosphoribosylamino)methylideneamino] imidazole-4-carboxamide isomerase n=1 Tax=Rhynchosporium secalis TaxID=38038 RepID=A0A1E1MNB4_RHYSE|nr:related to 5` Pro-FAR isomerase [Rhynchosporium secalis]